MRSSQQGYALLISMLLLTLTTGMIVFEFEYQKHQATVNRELVQELQKKTREDLIAANDQSKEKVHKFKNN